MYVVRTRVYVYVYVHVYVYVYVYVYACIAWIWRSHITGFCMHVCCANARVCMYLFVHVIYLYTYACTTTCRMQCNKLESVKSIYTLHRYMHTYITCIHIYAHIHTCSRSLYTELLRLVLEGRGVFMPYPAPRIDQEYSGEFALFEIQVI